MVINNQNSIFCISYFIIFYIFNFSIIIKYKATFVKRFNLFDIKIAEISRFVSTKNKNKIFKDCQKGLIDILVGTHALLNDKLQFKKLGLIIYDEEQN